MSRACGPRSSSRGGLARHIPTSSGSSRISSVHRGTTIRPSPRSSFPSSTRSSGSTSIRPRRGGLGIRDPARVHLDAGAGRSVSVVALRGVASAPQRARSRHRCVGRALQQDARADVEGPRSHLHRRSGCGRSKASCRRRWQRCSRRRLRSTPRDPLDRERPVAREGVGWPGREPAGCSFARPGRMFRRQGLGRRQPQAIRDAQSDLAVTTDIIQRRGTHAMYGVPLHFGADLIGVAMMGSSTTYQFSHDDLLLFRTAASRWRRSSRMRGWTSRAPAKRHARKHPLRARRPRRGICDPRRRAGGGGE